jgi:hypothetical protein
MHEKVINCCFPQTALNLIAFVFLCNTSSVRYINPELENIEKHSERKSTNRINLIRSTFDSEMLKDSEKVCFYNQFKLRQSLISCEKSIEWLTVSTEAFMIFKRRVIWRGAKRLLNVDAGHSLVLRVEIGRCLMETRTELIENCLNFSYLAALTDEFI